MGDEIMSEELQMTISGVVPKDGRPVIYVSFLDGSMRAEGCIPECKITENHGFSEDDIAILEQYMKTQQDEIREMAKHLTPMDTFLKS